MEKFDLIYGEEITPNCWHPCHVQELNDYLHQRGYRFEVYKCLDCSRFIVILDNCQSYYRSCADLCETFKDLFFKEKRKEYDEYIQNRASRDLKNIELKELMYGKSSK